MKVVEHVNSLSERETHDSFRFLQQFYERLKQFEIRHDHAVLANFLEEFDREIDAGEQGSLETDLDLSGPDMVRIMTIHGSKGLEFRFVFLVNLVDQKFPTRKRADAIPLPEGLVNDEMKHKDWHLEEERRLFYVAMTRAKQGLFFTSADDYGGVRKRKLSRFLNELGYEKPTIVINTNQNVFAEPEAIIVADEQKMRLELPKQFSFTQLAAFKTCPLQYKFAHIFKIPVFGKWTFSFGKTMHNTLHEYFKVWLERSGSEQGSLFDSVEAVEDGEFPVSREELLKMYDAHWQNDWYVNDTQREEYREKGRQSLLSYTRFLEKQWPDPLHLELGFTLKIGSIVIKGRFDRIDRFEDGIEIIDYKTGNPKTLKKMRKEEKEQLLLYQLAATDALNMNVKKLTFHYLEDHSQVSFLGTEDELLDLRESIVERIEKMKTSNFDPTSGFHCQFCDFADICEYKSKK
jgi:DNA helicase II / ATP-dependent DNA helicase PcrA